MTTASIETPAKFFRDLGGLHDSKVTTLLWDSSSAALAIAVDDLNANFRGLPDYRGQAPGTLSFTGVTRLSITCDAPNDGPLRIFEVECTSSGAHQSIVLLLSPHGRVELDCRSVSVES